MSDDNKEPRTFQDTVRDAWLSVLGVFSTAETEVHKATTRLLESVGLAGEGNLASELIARMRKNRDEFERRIDEGVKSAIARVRAPIDKEIATLKARVEQMQTRVEEQRLKRAQKKKAKES
jgi:hypothetical protein